MTDYSTLKGLRVRTLSTDTVASQASGGTWASGTDLNTTKFASGSGGTGNNSAIVFGGFTPTALALTETYNGSSWTEVNDLNTARGGGAGIGNDSITANLYVGSGFPTSAPVSAQNESWNGTSWTEVGDLNAGKQYLSSAGTQTSGIVFGGRTDPSTPTGQTETWNGTSWTEVNDLNSARLSAAGVGTQTAALNIGGLPSPGNPTSNLVESWNGTSWSEITEINTGRRNGGSAGEQTDALFFGGLIDPANSANTEYYDGSTWTELADLSVARYGISNGSIGTSGTSLATGGYTTTYVAATEEWSAPALFSKENLGQVFYNSTSNAFKVTKQSVPAGTWASGADFNTARHSTGGFGLNNSDSLMAGGYAPPGTPSNATEKYDGTSWTTDPATLNTSRYDAVGFGTSKEAGRAVGGYSTTLLGLNELYNGTSWTETANLNTARSASTGGGTQTSAIYALGYSGSYPNTTASESWNGTSWTTTSSANTGRAGSGGAGTSNTSVLVFGGDTYDGTPGSLPTRVSSASESWNGTSWTATPSLNTGVFDGGGFGTATSAIKFGGNASPGIVTNTEFYNGTSWTEVNDLGIGARYVNLGTVGTSISGLQAGGTTPASSFSVTTQEWAAGTANSTLTAS